MNDSITITCVSENTALSHSLLAQHGQSLHINYFGKEYLFDTGEIYEGFIYNIEHLGIKIENIEAIIMSHPHLDHFGALPKLLSKLTTQKIFLPPDMPYLINNEQKTKYSKTYRQINGKELTSEEILLFVRNYQNAVFSEEAEEIVSGIFTTGALLTQEEYREQSLVMNIPNKGLVILIACAHPGIPAIMEKAKQVTGVERIYGIIGGLHYKGLPDEKILENMSFLQTVNPDFIVPSHCTGYKAIRIMQEKLGDKVKVSGTGQFGTGSSIQIFPELVFNLPQK